MALLARLAAAGRAGVPRDHLIALLWPDAPSDRGRHALSNWLYRVRKELTRDAIEGWGDSLRLEPDTWSVDYWDFEEANDNGNAERAVAAYGGPFLDGIRVNNVSVEHWIDQERRRLSGEFVLALEHLAVQAAGRNDASEAVRWWRRAVHQDPLHSARTVQLMLWLARSGDAAAALRAAARLTELRQAELGLGPEPAVRAVEAAIRAGEVTVIGVRRLVADEPGTP